MIPEESKVEESNDKVTKIDQILSELLTEIDVIELEKEEEILR